MYTLFLTNRDNMKTKSLNLILCSLLLLACFSFSAVQNISAQLTPEAVIKAFYNGYIRVTGKGNDPFGKRSTLKKHLTARLIKEQVTAYEASQEADYFLRSLRYHSEWENNFILSKPVVKGAIATAVVTFPDGAARVKVTLKKEAGVWKIDRVQNAPHRVGQRRPNTTTTVANQIR